MRSDDHVQLCLRICLPHHSEHGQQMHGVAEKAEVEDHYFPGVSRALVEIIGMDTGHSPQLKMQNGDNKVELRFSTHRNPMQIVCACVIFRSTFMVSTRIVW